MIEVSRLSALIAVTKPTYRKSGSFHTSYGRLSDIADAPWAMPDGKLGAGQERLVHATRGRDYCQSSHSRGPKQRDYA